MADEHTADPFDAVLEAFNADRTPGPRAVMLHRLVSVTGLKRRVVFDELEACGWCEATARARLYSDVEGE